ncbi:cytoplasmic dynein 2 intermediate chain 1-like isoform X5 [Mytilus galloprovincialis]|uniref:cytoplasmic dynein 2 intermediate chain 1-like isoform X5 n=1 Tax=Mytilus galloprovincialis TaxID=29158 RepID=UPI003F7B9CC3
MPVEKKSKEDTWTPSELKKAMGKDTLRREREERKKERLRDDQNGEEKHRRRKDEDETRERRHHRDDDDRKHHKEKDRHHRNEDDEGRRRRRDRDSPDRIETTEEDRERQRRERREKREGKSKGDDDRRRKDDDDSKRRRHKDEDRERSNKDEERRRHRDGDEKRRHRDDDEKRRHRDDDERRRDKDDEKRRHRGDDDREKRRHRDDDDREKRRHRDEDGDRRGHRGEDDREKRKHHRDEDDRDRRKEKKDRDRHKESEEGSKKHRRHRDEEDEEMETELDEDERERQRRERRDKKEGKDRKDGDREKDDRDKRSKEERGKSAKSRDVRTKSAVNGRSKPKEEDEEENEYGGYEDDFEDYDDDFEEEEDEDEDPPKKRPEYNHSDDEMNDVLRALDEENDRLYKDSSKQDKYDRSDSPEDRGRGYRDSSPDEPVQRTRPKSSAINFLSAKRQVMTQKTYGKTSKRARDLLEMIELDTVTFDIMDLPPVKEYELYIRSYGRSDTRQAYVQTNDDAIDRDIQTEEIDMRNKWTQHPPEDFAGSGRGDGEKDFEDEEQSQQNKQQDLGRLSKFIQQAGQVVSILLDEERSQETTELRSNKSSISMSEGYTELSKLGILQGRHVEFAYFAPTQPNMLLTIYSQPEQSNPSNPTDGKGMICVWNTNEPSYPQRILACESQPRCCCFGPYKTSIAFAGMVDGSICAWDLREPPSLHRSVEFDKTEHLLRFPTYNTAGISDSDNHISPVTTINPVTTYVDENSQQESDSKEESGFGMSFQLVSSEDQGRINFWVVAELTTTDPAGSEIDLGLSPGGKLKVVISSTIKLESLVRKARSLGPIRSFEMQISPTDPNHFYIGTDGGYVLHGLRFGNRAFPRTFSALSDSPVDVRSIDFSPFGHPCFLASTAEGCVHLFGTKSDIYVLDEKPLLTWPSKIWGTRNLRCVRWSRSRPCVFYVLDDQSQLYTFDILEGDAMPAKMENLSKENVIHIAFTPHINVTGRHPQMLVSQEDGTIQIHTISKEYREQQTLEDDFLPSYLDKF